MDCSRQKIRVAAISAVSCFALSLSAALAAEAVSVPITNAPPKAAPVVKASTQPATQPVQQQPTAAAPKPGAPAAGAATKVKKSIKTAKAKKGKGTEIAKAQANAVDVEAASYEAFSLDVEKAAKMDIRTPKDVRSVETQFQKHVPEQLSMGWIAYSARIVAKNDAFANAVKADVAKDGRQAVMDRITRDPKYVMGLPGAYAALDQLMASVATDTTKMSQLGDRFIKVAYAFQKEKWGYNETTPLPHDTGTPEHAYIIPAGFFGDIFSGSDTPAAPKGGAEMGTVSKRVLQLAASLTTGPVENATAVSLSQDKEMTQCLRWARLNLNQCVAAAHFPSEHAYCTGKHGINEVSSCWIRLLPTKS